MTYARSARQASIAIAQIVFKIIGSELVFDLLLILLEIFRLLFCADRDAKGFDEGRCRGFAGFAFETRCFDFDLSVFVNGYDGCFHKLVYG